MTESGCCSKLIVCVFLLVGVGLIALGSSYWKLELNGFSVKALNSKPRIESILAMCLIVKNDELDILEWIEYHNRLGCSKFYIFDHNSTIPMRSVIESHIESGLVRYENNAFSEVANPQLHVYNRCLKEFGSRHKFIAFLDSDEFIVVVNKSQSIPDVLKKYENYGGLALNWKLFGSSGHVSRPPGGILENYHMCGDNFHIKTIANPKFTVRSGGNPHEFRYKPGYFAVDTNYTRVTGPFNPKIFATPDPVVYSVMYINHYNLKSREDYARKVAKGKADNSRPSAAWLFNATDNSAANECGFLQMPNETVV